MAFGFILGVFGVSVSKGGRPRKPEALKRLHGTARADRKVGKIASPNGRPLMPVGISRQARRIWKSLGPSVVEPVGGFAFLMSKPIGGGLRVALLAWIASQNTSSEQHLKKWREDDRF